jgi:endonuclease I
VQNAQGADIYAWNAVVEQPVVNPGEKVAFKSRLASPPAEAHTLVVRFFHRRDLASGSV